MTAQRRGLDALLAEYPDHDIVRCVHQGITNTGVEIPGPWTTVTLGTPHPDPDDPYATHFHDLKRFAIVNHTGEVFELDEEGVLREPAILTPR